MTASIFKNSYCPNVDCETNGNTYHTKSKKCIFCGAILEKVKKGDAIDVD